MPRLPHSELAAKWIATRIINGVFPPGSSVTEELVAQQLGTSRSPVKEAVIRLEGEGLIETRRFLGARVPPLSPSEIETITTRMADLLKLVKLRSTETLTDPNDDGTAWGYGTAERQGYDQLLELDRIDEHLFGWLHTQLWRYGPVIMKLQRKNGRPPTFEVFQMLAKEGDTARAASAMILIGKEIAAELERNSYNQEDHRTGRFVQREVPPRKIRTIKTLTFD